MAKGKTLTAIIGLLKGVPQEEIDKAIADADALEKAQGAERGDGGEVKDHWQAGQKHAVPTREEIKTGPSESSSGAGAERMVREYSSPAPQHGVQIDAEKLGKILEDWTAKSHALMRAELARFATLLMSKADEEEEEEGEEESEVVEINEKSARKLIDKAKKLIKAAAAKDLEADDATEHAAEKALKREARRLRKAAGRALGKAITASFAMRAVKKSRDAGKALTGEIRAIATKADVEVIQEEEEDDEEEDAEKARAAAAAAKGAEAGKDAGGNQADKQDKENGNQDDAAKKSIADMTALKGQVEDALKGLTTLQGSVHSVLDSLSGKSPAGAGGTKPDTSALAKGGETMDLDAISAEIEAAQDNGRLDAGAAMRARNIVMQLDALAKGRIARSVVEASINVAPSAVKSIFDGFFKKAA